MFLGEFGHYPKISISLSHALSPNDRMHKKKVWILWLLRREFGHHMSNLMSMHLPLLEICLMCSHAFLFEMYLMYVLWFGRKDNSDMMYKGACLYYVYETSHMFIIILLLHDLQFDNARRQQECLLLWLLLGEYGLNFLHTNHDICMAHSR